MRIPFLSLAVLASLLACGGGEDEASTQVIKSFGSLQCSGGGVTLSTLQGQLVAANVKVGTATCGADGVARPTVCGSSDGKIGIFEISTAQVSAAAAAGFVPLTSVPTAKPVACT